MTAPLRSLKIDILLLFAKQIVHSKKYGAQAVCI